MIPGFLPQEGIRIQNRVISGSWRKINHGRFFYSIPTNNSYNYCSTIQLRIRINMAYLNHQIMWSFFVSFLNSNFILFFKMKARVLHPTHDPTCIAILFYFLEIYLSGFNSHNAIYQQLHIIRMIKDLTYVCYHSGCVRIMTTHHDYINKFWFYIIWGFFYR